MAMDVFKSPSTFTWVGRHASELRFLLSTVEEWAEDFLDIGKGPFKPFYLSEMLPPDSNLTVFDTPEMCDIVERIKAGESILLADLSRVVCNKDDAGSPIPNTDLTDPALLNLSMSELRLAGIDPVQYVDLERGTFRAPQRRITTIRATDSLENYLSDKEARFDFVYLGLVLLNMAKVSSREELVRLSRALLNSLSCGGVLGIGEHPRALYGEKSIPAVLEGAGGLLTDAYVDNLVQARGNLRGGHCLRFVNADDPQFSSTHSDTINRLVQSDELLRQANVEYRQVDGDRIGRYFSSKSDVQTDTVLIAALRRNGGYDVWEAPMDRVMQIAPTTRRTLSLIPGLRY